MCKAPFLSRLKLVRRRRDAGRSGANQPVTHAQLTSAEETPAAPVSAVQQNPALSTSQRLWNAAYDNLENEEDTAKLVRAYVKVLTTVLLGPDKSRGSSASGADEVSTELKDPAKRQEHMKKLFDEGQARVSTAWKIKAGMGEVAQFILSAKAMIDVAINALPQAALPWAGVCVGLLVSNHSSISWFPCRLISIRSSRILRKQQNPTRRASSMLFPA
jgi:N-terminal domain of NWD NACHT-NTPase